MSTAVVLGGGLAGVLAATVLARHADDVVLIEGGRYPAVPGPRPGLPQGYHNHVLVAGGAQALDELLPGTVGALLDRGAHRCELPGGALIHSAAGWFHRCDTGAYLLSGSRWLVDQVVRERTLANGAVSVREDTRVLGLAGDPEEITGAVVEHPDGRVGTLRADLVVDATGRRSRAPQWLAALGADPVAEEVVDPGMAYATRVYRAPAALGGGIPAVMVHPRPANGRPEHGATLFPIEYGRWIVTLTGTRGATPPVDPAAFTAAAYGLSTPLVAELMAAAEPLGRVRPYRATANRRRYFERGPGPAGFLVIGDALMALNPFYSHGMSVAALTAVRLAAELARAGLDPGAAPGWQTAVADVAQPCWRMATDTDRRLIPGPQNGPAGGTGSDGGTGSGGLIGPRLSRAVPGSRALLTAMFRAQTLLPPDRTAGAPTLAELAGGAAPLTTDQAIAQYPQLAAWWRGTGRTATGVPAIATGASA